jgi:hypothetical protein
MEITLDKKSCVHDEQLLFLFLTILKHDFSLESISKDNTFLLKMTGHQHPLEKNKK